MLIFDFLKFQKKLSPLLRDYFDQQLVQKSEELLSFHNGFSDINGCGIIRQVC